MEEEKNYIRCRTIIEVLGKPKEHVENAIQMYIKQIKADTGILIIKEYFSDSQVQDDMFSTFADLEIIFKDFSQVIGFCFDYMPSSMEILKPEALAIKNRELSNILNDLQAKLHSVDMVAKKLRNEADFLKKNLKTSLKNNILIVLAVKKEAPIGEIARLSGIAQEELDKFLTELVAEGKIKKEADSYSLL
ncbi:MAG TPA: hypothetical protein VJH97_07175 [Candidatus Nanoarchaeia archaeon]|nr:hypothetical protein [Candidatus Nanoarchaeia archaeon]